MDANLIVTAAGVIVALFIGGMQVWIAFQQRDTADKQADLAHLQGKLQTQLGELQTVSSWLPFLTDDNPNARLAAIVALDAINGESAVAALVTALTDEKLIVRDRAARALARRVNDKNVDAIIEIVASVFENEDPSKAQAALGTLVNIGGRSIERLQAALRKPLPSSSKRQAEQALGRILLNEQVMKKIGVQDSHEITRGSPEIVVALIGSGVDTSMEDIAEALIEEVDHVGDGSGPGKSTTLAAKLIVGHPESDVVGVAPDVRLLSEKVLGSNGGGSVGDMIKGIDHAMRVGAQVIFLELGSRFATEDMARAIERAHDAGALVIAAAGNRSSEEEHYPAALDNVLAVAATDGNDRKASYSSYGDWIDIAAPGNPTLGQEGAAGTFSLKGTSFSGSLAAGAAALVWSAYPSASAEMVEKALFETAEDLDALNPDFAGKLGHGRMNVFAAIQNIMAKAALGQ